MLFRSMEVFEAVKKQTGKSFFFNTDDLDMTSRISINIKGQNLETVLKQILKDQGLDFEIKDNNIVLFKAKASPITNQSDVAKTIRGKVVDATGEPLIGVNVMVNGVAASITDIDGNYSVKAANGNTLTFTYIGYKPETVKLRDNRSQLNIRLEEDSKTLDEVVVVGYGTQKKVNLTGAVGYTDSKAIENRPVAKIGRAHV